MSAARRCSIALGASHSAVSDHFPALRLKKEPQNTKNRPQSSNRRGIMVLAVRKFTNLTQFQEGLGMV